MARRRREREGWWAGGTAVATTKDALQLLPNFGCNDAQGTTGAGEREKEAALLDMSLLDREKDRDKLNTFMSRMKTDYSRNFKFIDGAQTASAALSMAYIEKHHETTTLAVLPRRL